MEKKKKKRHGTGLHFKATKKNSDFWIQQSLKKATGVFCSAEPLGFRTV